MCLGMNLYVKTEKKKVDALGKTNEIENYIELTS